MKLKLIRLSESNPEEYDIYHNGEKIGFMHLMNGRFYAYCFNQIFYEAKTNGFGIFDTSERSFHLAKASASIIAALEQTQDNYTIEGSV